jgi:hypothetical protein
MEVVLSALLTLYAYSTGRRLFALQQVKKEATLAGHVALAAHCDVAIDHDKSTRSLEARWLAQNPDAQFSPEAKQLDIVVDVALGALRDAVDAAARASAQGDPLGEAAVKLGDELFPGTVADITTLPFVEELGQVARILDTLKSQAWSQKVQELGLSRHVVYLTGLEQKYRAAIEKDTKISFNDVKAARAKGQSLMLQAMAMILGLHPSDSAADQAGRAKLMGPILTQNEAIPAYLRARRAVSDVDPETGVEEAAPEGEAPGGGAPEGGQVPGGGAVPGGGSPG